MRYNALARAREFANTPHPGQPVVDARRIDRLERRIRRVQGQVSSPNVGGSGEASYIDILDQLPDPTSDDIGRIILVRGPSGEPSRGFIGAEGHEDTAYWMPAFTIGFEGAATEWDDELYSRAHWTATGTVTGSDAEANHPGLQTLSTAATTNSTSQLTLSGNVEPGDIDQMAFVFKTGSVITSCSIEVGVLNNATAFKLNLLKLAASTGWRFNKTEAGVDTIQVAGMTATTSTWYLFQIRRVKAGEFLFALTDLSTGAYVSFTHTGVTETSDLSPYFWVQTTEAVAKSIKADYFWIRHNPLVRS